MTSFCKTVTNTHTRRLLIDTAVVKLCCTVNITIIVPSVCNTEVQSAMDAKCRTLGQTYPNGWQGTIKELPHRQNTERTSTLGDVATEEQIFGGHLFLVCQKKTKNEENIIARFKIYIYFRSSCRFFLCPSTTSTAIFSFFFLPECVPPKDVIWYQ